MKKVIIAFVSIIVFLLVKDTTTVNAASDLSNNFVQIKLDNRGPIIHVEATLDDYRDAFQDGDTMMITWKSLNNQLKAQGVRQTKDICINDQQVGTCIVNDDFVLLKFNSKVEDYSNIDGKVSFDVQVNNLTDTERKLMFYAGNSERSVLVASQSTTGARISGKRTQNNIAWKIWINLDSKLPLEAAKLENIIPSNLAIDKRSLKVKSDGQLIDKDIAKIDNNNLSINFANDLKRPLTIEYNTKILDLDAAPQPNILKLNYQLEGEETPRVNSYEGWSNSEAEVFLTGQYGNQLSKNTAEKQEMATRISQALAKLMEIAEKKAASDSSAMTTAIKKDEETVSLPQVKTQGLTGFNSVNSKSNEANEESKNVKSVKNNDSSDTAKENSKMAGSAKRNKRVNKTLPKAGETTNALRLIGIILLLTGYIGFKAKFLKF